MRSTTRLGSAWVFFGMMAVLGGGLLISIPSADAQTVCPGYTAGNNAVWLYGTACTQSVQFEIVGSTDFIDASKLATGQDICAVIYGILNSTGYTPVVIDARGISSNMVCAQNTSPWLQNGVYVNKPSTLLLPAQTITIPLTWILPNGTKIIGEGTTTITNQSGTIEQTTIQACTNSISGCPTTNFGTSTPMIQFGDQNCPQPACTGISIENLTLNGNGLDVIGIQNENSQELSYVDHLTLYQILGIGLQVSGGAQDSGPYANITFDTGAYPGGSTIACAQINGLTSTRGIHGLSCKSESTAAPTAIFLDSSNNTIEDTRILGFDTGILIGSQAAAHSNVLFNIYGDTSTSGPAVVINVIEISASNPVTDLSIMGVANAGGTGTHTIADLLTSATLADSYVAMYVLGQAKNGGYSRFTTSPNATTWVVGNPTNANAPNFACAIGSLYSNTSGSGTALYVCDVTTSSWKPVK